MNIKELLLLLFIVYTYREYVSSEKCTCI